jgi:Fe-S cluster assembly iron-binding protein IscA
MLTLTDNAVSVIRDITDRRDAPEGAGVRIAADPTAGALTFSLAADPIAGDQVLDASGARLFLDVKAAAVLDDKALDARIDTEGHVKFAIADQPG